MPLGSTSTTTEPGRGVGNSFLVTTGMGKRGRAYVEQNHSVHGLPGYLRGLYTLALGESPTPNPQCLATLGKSL